jgi:hypothetical protein
MRPVFGGGTPVVAISFVLLATFAVRAGGAAPPAPSFCQDVLPILTRYGCNAGACHGKLAGQNGFKLSLRAYAPELDHPSLTRDLSARRIDYARPEDSLLLRKATGQVPHEGGKRFDADSEAYRTLAAWIAARTPGPVPNEADAARLEILPGSRSMRVGESQQLTARATYPDGRVRDVTWLAQFFSNDETTAKVTPAGVVTTLRPGETSIRAHFQGQVGVVLVTTPFENPVPSGAFAAKNNVVDEHVFAKLATLNVPPSKPSDDATFIRRAFLDATGALPSPGQVRDFLADADPSKRSKLIDKLLDSPEYVDYWTLQLCDVLQNRKERDHDVRGVKGVRSFQAWVRSQVAANRPWNEIAKAVLTAAGDVGTNPQIGYFITVIGEKDNPGDSEVADSVAQSFLGTRIGCAKCHNHPLEKFTQDDYYHFAAFFARVSMNRVEPKEGRPTELYVATREEKDRRRELKQRETSLAESATALAAIASAGKGAGELARSKAQVDERLKQVEEARKQLDELAARPPTVTQPRTHQPLKPRALDRADKELKPGQDPREVLTAWMTDPANEQFSGAMVNRLWRHFMGVGLVEPVDDLRSSNPPTNPALWKALNREFVAHGYDLKHVMRLILNSRAYQLGAETEAGNEQDRKFYSHYYARRLPAEVILDAVSAATSVPDNFSGYPLGTRAVQLPEPGVDNYFLTLFGRSDRVTACACERSGDVTLPQLLHLSNGDSTDGKLRSAESRVAALAKQGDDRRAVEEAFLCTVSRLPKPEEADAVAKLLASGDPKLDVYRDLFWALLNSKEFAFNH